MSVRVVFARRQVVLSFGAVLLSMTALTQQALGQGVQAHPTPSSKAAKTSLVTLPQNAKSVSQSRMQTVRSVQAGKGEKISVRGIRSASETQLASHNDVSVVDANFIAHHPDTNIAETLARLPGVNVLSTTVGGSIGGTASMIDNASRGEGQFISVRGIGPDYTLNLIDGVNVATAKPASRQVQLSLMPPLGFSQVVVSKTGQASDMGEWIAGFVDFRTPSAFELGHDVISLKGRGDFGVQGYDYGLYRGPFNGGGIAQGEVSKVLGPENRFGVHALAYYQSRNFASQASNQNEGNWDFLRTETGSNHAPLSTIAPAENMIPEQVNPQVSYGNSQRFGGNLALDWRGDGISLFARGTYASSDTQQTTIQRGLQSTNQIAVEQPDGTFLTDEAGVVGSYYVNTNPEKQDLATMQLGGKVDYRWFHATLTGFGSFASDDQDAIQIAYKNYNLDPSGETLLLNPVYRGNPGFPIVPLAQAQLAEMNNLGGYVPQTNDNWGFPGVERTEYKNNQALGGIKADFRATTGQSFLPSILFGAKYYMSDRHATNRDYSYDNPDGLLPGLPSSLVGNRLQNGSLSSPVLGKLKSLANYQTPLLDTAMLGRYLEGLPMSYASASYGGNWTGSAIQTAYNANVNTQSAREHVTAGYVALPFHFGMVSLTPGVRFEHSEISNRFWTASYDEDDAVTGGNFASNSTKFNEFLPSVYATLRPDARSVYRASFDTSYVRPNTFLLGGARTVTSNGDNVFTIQEGNPSLRPVVSRNFDVGGQWLMPDGSSFAISGFFKLMSHYLFDAGNSTRSDGTRYLSANGTEQISPTLIVITPRNGGSARAYGLEMAANKRLSFLPSFWKNVSLSGNATLQRTHANLNLAGIGNGTPIQYAPSWMFNVSLGYDDHRLSTNLSFRKSGRFLETYYTYSAQNGRTVDISWWSQPIQRLDYFLGYNVTKRLNVAFSAQNLLGDASYSATRGKRSGQIPQIVLPGRSFFLTAGYSF
ncbi:TonB-dependent receptor [Asaia astilbis]|uniref:TonB-dependent receptor n=1 Tax=Asaia astilbis TaxID=610244 RepID=UPI00046E7047|nr:TonB-dependent receptor [Asaia astilbis]